MTALLELCNINLKTDTDYRLKDINIKIHSGEKIALIGKSGSGKTTLIHIANGVLLPTNGTISFQGKDITKLNRLQKSLIGTLWQDIRLIDELSVGQNINVGALSRHNLLWSITNLFSEIANRACDDCLKAVQLPTSFKNRNIDKLSFGQLKRVAIARLIRQKPLVILADEPLANLDPYLAKFILHILLNKTQNNVLGIPETSLISLHHSQYVEEFTRVIAIEEGRVIFDCPATNVSKKEISNLYN